MATAHWPRSAGGEFTDRSLYIYVIDGNGVMLASNGGSNALIGRNMSNYADSDGKTFFQEMLDASRTQGSGTVEYRWLNTQHGRVEKKVAHYQTVGNRILAVGYYQPRATPEQAKTVSTQAVDALKSLGPNAFARYNDLNGGFVRDDTYVFVVGIKDFRMRAHGSMPLDRQKCRRPD